MNKINKTFLLSKIFNIPKNHVLSPGDIAYHSSLTPLLNVLKNITKLYFVVSIENHLPNKFFKRIANQNDINHHLFKPKYYQCDKSDEIYCYVPSNDVLIHTLRSIALLSHFVNKKNDILINVNYKKLCYSQLKKDWYFHERLLISRVQSALSFFRLLWLANYSKVSWSEIKEISLIIEKSRIYSSIRDYGRYVEQKYLNKYSLSFKQIDEYLKINTEFTNSEYLEIVNLVYSGIPITIIQLQWGCYLTESLLKIILNSRSKVKKIGIVGGVGYVGKNEKTNIDDIFIPTSLITSSNELKFLNNLALTIKNNKYFNNKNIHKGSLKTIRPRLGLLSYKKSFLKEGESLCDAVDMEKEAFMKLLDQKNIKWASMYYIMDTPLKGINLGDTYYNKQYLIKLFSNFNRGKYYCYEKIINFLLD